MSHWLTIWTKPRETIRSIVADNPNLSLWPLAFIYGFSSLMNIMQAIVAGEAIGLAGIVILSALLAPFWGWVLFTAWSWVVTWIGRLLKGEGTFKNIRASYAWSCVPLLFNIPIWGLLILLFGQALFLNMTQAEILPQGIAVLLLCIWVLKVVLSVWSLIIYIATLSEVQNFSVFKAIVNIIGAIALVFAVFTLLLWSIS